MSERAMPAAGWTKVAFSDVVRQVKDRVNPEQSGLERYVAGEHMTTDDLRIRRWGDIGDGDLGPAFHMRFKPGQVLYGSRRTYLRKVAVADFEGITANTTYVLEPKDANVLLPELLPFIMQADRFSEHSVRESKGSVNPYVNFSDLAWYEFALPPIEEQREIAKSLIAMQLSLETLQSLHEAALQVVSSLRYALVPLPHDDSRTSVGDVAALSLNQRQVESNETYRIAGVYSFGRGLIDRGPLMGAETKYRYLHELQSGQIVFSKLKAWEGAVAVTSEAFQGYCVSPEYPTLTIRGDVMLPAFMQLICESEWFWAEILRRCRGTAERRARIHPNDFLLLPIPRLPLRDQVRIVCQVDEAKAAAVLVAQKCDKSREMKRALLASLMSSSGGKQK